MLNAGVPIARVAKITRWSTTSVIRVSDRYGRFTLDELREAVDSISSTTIRPESPDIFPGIGRGFHAQSAQLIGKYGS